MSTSARSTGLGEKANEESKTNYSVRVEIRELTNRIVEGRVRNHRLLIDQPKEFGADDTAPTPPETLAFALGSCIVSTGRLMAMQKKVNVKSIGAVVEGELDFAKAMGMSEERRAGYRGFRIAVTIDSDMSVDEKTKFVQELNARCPMCDNISNATPVVVQLKQ